MAVVVELIIHQQLPDSLVVVEAVVVEVLQVLVEQEIHLLLVRLKEIMVELDHRVLKTVVAVAVELGQLEQTIIQEVVLEMVE